jgi:ribosome maturation factor RimP
MYRDIPEELRALVEPVVEDHGYELVDADSARGPGGVRVRIVIDTPAGDGRVSIDRCAEVSREIGTCLDAAGAVPTPYTLEVSSPGLDRVLGREKDFAAACGAEVKLEARQPIDGRRRFRGVLEAFEGGVVRLLVDGERIEIPFEAVARGRRVYHFSSADFGRRRETNAPADGGGRAARARPQQAGAEPAEPVRGSEEAR